MSTSQEQTEMASQAQSRLAPATPDGETAAPPPSAPPALASAAGGPPADYIGQVRARIERNKRYPSAARKYGQEGTVLLAFDLDRSGQVTTWKIVRGSGYPALDGEVGEMIGRTTFPPFPESITGNRLRLQVPIEFSLQRP
ncbi:energy transducer TonB [Telmatospirillum siberiense]|uniref:energy transducer TonB n=1 Tax=Telmatospirillum siberiense TaxID=382514 RepID=UPI00130430F5|nr:energy transducer TonB [Telmatospirillum siberiense]